MTLIQLLEAFVPVFIAGLPVVVIILRNQANAQAILNRQYEKVVADLEATKQALASAREQFAEERGRLTEKVAGLERMLKEERHDAEERNRENVQKVATLETKLQQVTEERDQLRRKLDSETENWARRERDLNSKITALQSRLDTMQQAAPA